VNAEVDVLVVGAVPTGLALALQAYDHGARIRVVDRRPEAFRPSRALIMHPRTLEVLRPLGVTDALLARANTAPEVSLGIGSRRVRVRLDRLSIPGTAFPHLTLIRQTDVEAVLLNALAARGITVERGRTVTGVHDEGTQVRASLVTQAGSEEIACGYVAGCDGPESAVRQAAGIAWHGGPYRSEVVLADVELDADINPDIAHAVVGREGLLLAFPLGERSTWRLLLTQPTQGDPLAFGVPGPSVSVGSLQALLDDAGLAARITELTWSARYRLQHRLAEHFRQGRLFLAGDAAHTYSPATGQGMNTGIQDALNLGWKLAFAASATDSGALLQSYEAERRPVARRTLLLTHLAFWAEADTGPLPVFLRGVVVPLTAPVVPMLLARRRLIGQVERVLSQMAAAYRSSPLAVEGNPRLWRRPRAGQRLPDATVSVGSAQVRLHDLLAQPGMHVLLHRDAAPLPRDVFGPHVTVHRVASIPGAGVVVVRPDGYIGFRSGRTEVSQIGDWLGRVGAWTPGPRSAPASLRNCAARHLLGTRPTD
jgi:2-polyprenyl-6-methoxyphenol hydroxylase-like FAD-dependent oxidoreductase